MNAQFKKSLKLVSSIAIIWNLFGVKAYLMQVFMTDTTIAALPMAEQELYRNIPSWYTAAFATAVFAGLIASILLLVKKRFSTSFFMISFIAILVQMYYLFFIMKITETQGLSSIIMPVLVTIIAFFLLWYSRKMDELAVLS